MRRLSITHFISLVLHKKIKDAAALLSIYARLTLETGYF